MSIKTHNTESRFVIRPSNILLAGVYVCTFQTGNFTHLGSEGVKTAMKSLTRGKTVAFMKLILCHLVGLGLLFSTKMAQDDKVHDR